MSSAPKLYDVHVSEGGPQWWRRVLKLAARGRLHTIEWSGVGRSEATAREEAIEVWASRFGDIEPECVTVAQRHGARQRRSSTATDDQTVPLQMQGAMDDDRRLRTPSSYVRATELRWYGSKTTVGLTGGFAQELAPGDDGYTPPPTEPPSAPHG
jgi:hypothetical protein